MGYFPLCIDLKGKKILLVGSGPQIEEKAEKLAPFGAVLVRCGDPLMFYLEDEIVFAVVGDTDRETASQISRICRERRIPVNVVDDPENSTFFFPSLITSGDVTVSVSTGGKAPGAAACLSRMIRKVIPEKSGEIIDDLHELRKRLYAQYPKKEAARRMREAVSRAFGSAGKN